MGDALAARTAQALTNLVLTNRLTFGLVGVEVTLPPSQARVSNGVLLRPWAEQTGEISQGAVKVNDVVGQLLTLPIPEREVTAARSLYDGLPDKVCVWMERRLADQFDVDRAIPFVL